MTTFANTFNQDQAQQNFRSDLYQNAVTVDLIVVMKFFTDINFENFIDAKYDKLTRTG